MFNKLKRDCLYNSLCLYCMKYTIYLLKLIVCRACVAAVLQPGILFSQSWCLGSRHSACSAWKGNIQAKQHNYIKAMFMYPWTQHSFPKTSIKEKKKIGRNFIQSSHPEVRSIICPFSPTSCLVTKIKQIITHNYFILYVI